VEFLQVGGVRKVIFSLPLATEGANLGQVPGREARWRGGQHERGYGHSAHAEVVEVDSSDSRFPHPGGLRLLLNGIRTF
jgi:hypothetical protein